MVLKGPNKSMSSNSSGLEVETTFIGLKELFFFFFFLPFWHASHNLSFSNLSLGSPTTSSFDAILLRWCIWIWANLLCHNQDSSFLVSKQFMLDVMQETLSIYTLFTLLPTRTFSLDFESAMRQRLGSKVILYPLSHSWLMLSKLCFNQSTKSTSLMITLSSPPMSQTPRILSRLLSP